MAAAGSQNVRARARSIMPFPFIHDCSLLPHRMIFQESMPCGCENCSGCKPWLRQNAGGDCFNGRREFGAKSNDRRPLMVWSRWTNEMTHHNFRSLTAEQYRPTVYSLPASSSPAKTYLRIQRSRLDKCGNCGALFRLTAGTCAHAFPLPDVTRHTAS